MALREFINGLECLHLAETCNQLLYDGCPESSRTFKIARQHYPTAMSGKVTHPSGDLRQSRDTIRMVLSCLVFVLCLLQ